MAQKLSVHKHVVITVYGSLGDLHPMMAIAFALQARGHRVTIAASTYYREKLAQAGIGFVPLRPYMELDNRKLAKELFDPVWGPERLMKRYILPTVREAAEDLEPLFETADFIVNSPIVFAAPIIAEKLNKPWASVGLQPFLYMSPHDPPVMPQLPTLTEGWRGFGLPFWGPLLRFMKYVSGTWAGEVYKLRKELGLPRGKNPIFEGQFSPYFNMAVFSPVMGGKQPDWPDNVHITGFAFYDDMTPGEQSLPPEIKDFLLKGEAPVVFTLGSSVVHGPGKFFEESMTAIRKLNRRAILVAGDNLSKSVDENILVWDFVPYSQLFPHAAVVVHQGGMGTTAQVMRAGRPMIVVPHGFDQHDNAARVKRLGISQTILPAQYKAHRVEKTLNEILSHERYALRAKEVGAIISQENGAAVAADLIEPYLS